MSRLSLWIVLLAALAIGPSLSGCGKPAGSESNEQPPNSATDEAGEQAGTTVSDPALAGLSAQDQAAVRKQQVCPVSGEPLGSMGKPYKVTVDGHEVFLCCQGCEAELRAHPEKYLAKVMGPVHN